MSMAPGKLSVILLVAAYRLTYWPPAECPITRTRTRFGNDCAARRIIESSAAYEPIRNGRAYVSDWERLPSFHPDSDQYSQLGVVDTPGSVSAMKCGATTRTPVRLLSPAWVTE